MRWIIPILCLALTSFTSPNDVISKNLALPISQKSVDVITYYEVGGEADYKRYYTKPEVPAWKTTSSGVTVGIGVDVGQMTKAQVAKAFDGVLSSSDIRLLQSVTGMKGKNAYYNALPLVKYKINLTWEQAEIVFKTYTLPSFTKQTADAFNLSTTRLHPHSNGALVSLVYNRGPSLDPNKSSRKEMRWINYNISIGREDRVPSDIKSMKRLWSYTTLKGLHLRRDDEAELFQLGLDSKR